MAKPNPLLLKIVFLGLPDLGRRALADRFAENVDSSRPTRLLSRPDRGGSGSNLPQYDSSEVHDKPSVI